MSGATRGYRGKLRYLTGGVETGREWFSVTVLADGTRTLRAQCEMDERALLRDSMLTVDSNWRPIDAYVRLALGGRTEGWVAYRFDDEGAHAEGWTVPRGAFRDHAPGPRPLAFGTHSLQNDAWTAARLRAHQGPADTFRFKTHTCSWSPDGGTGPGLVVIPLGATRVIDLGDADAECPLGRFATRHVRIEVPGVDEFDMWAAGEDALPIKLTSDGLGQSYELVALEGEWR